MVSCCVKGHTAVSAEPTIYTLGKPALARQTGGLSVFLGVGPSNGSMQPQSAGVSTLSERRRVTGTLNSLSTSAP